MEKTKKCEECGEKLLEDDKFCPSCGKPLNNEKEFNSNKQDLNVNNTLDKSKILANDFLNSADKKKINNNGDIMDNNVLEKLNTGLATVFSAIFIGLGQLYNGQIGKGICLFIIGVILASIELFFNMMLINAPAWAAGSILVLMIVVLIVYIFLWIYSVTDAHKNSKKM
jgi:TM2 domain-containing membrane protein YozV